LRIFYNREYDLNCTSATYNIGEDAWIFKDGSASAGGYIFNYTQFCVQTEEIIEDGISSSKFIDQLEVRFAEIEVSCHFLILESKIFHCTKILPHARKGVRSCHLSVRTYVTSISSHSFEAIELRFGTYLYATNMTKGIL